MTMLLMMKMENVKFNTLHTGSASNPIELGCEGFY